jgi:hypothetical protein
VHRDVARVFSVSFSLLATMRNEFPVFVGRILFEPPLLELPGVLRCAGTFSQPGLNDFRGVLPTDLLRKPCLWDICSRIRSKDHR